MAVETILDRLKLLDGESAARNAFDRAPCRRIRGTLMSRRIYERDGAAIYRQSFAIIRAEADLRRFEGHAERVVVRMIHACGMIDLATGCGHVPGASPRAPCGALQGRRSDPLRLADGGGRHHPLAPSGGQ